MLVIVYQVSLCYAVLQALGLSQNGVLEKVKKVKAELSKFQISLGVINFIEE